MKATWQTQAASCRERARRGMRPAAAWPALRRRCATGTPAAYGTICNGIDDNCNGATDEGYVADDAASCLEHALRVMRPAAARPALKQPVRRVRHRVKFVMIWTITATVKQMKACLGSPISAMLTMTALVILIMLHRPALHLPAM